MTPERREAISAQLLERARRDTQVVGAAITGSIARGAADRWSDIDLYLGVAADADLGAVLAQWSDFAYGELRALHHFDLHAGGVIYRAFLLAELVEVELAFARPGEFGPHGDGEFAVVFGTALPRRSSPPLDTEHVIGRSWHHVLHARNAIERGKLWEAEYWISAIRDNTLTLAAARLGLPTHYAKGADALPAQLKSALEDALVGALRPDELRRALAVAASALTAELRRSSASAAAVLAGPLEALAGQLPRPR